MKKNNYTKVALAFVAMVALCFSCITIDSVSLPDEVNAGETIEFDIDWTFTAETERTGNFVLAMLFPKSWAAANSIEASYTTKDLPTQGQFSDEIVDEKMVICNSDLEPTYGVPYSSAAQAHYGSCGNFGALEWVCLKSQTVFETNGKANDAEGNHIPMYIKVHVKVKVGDPNLAYNFAAGICGTQSGFGGDDEYSDAFKKYVTIKNGTGDSVDYTVAPPVSTTPGEIGYGDIFCINFCAKTEKRESPVYGEKELYVMMKATLKNGNVKELSTKDKNNILTSTDNVNFTKYVYLPTLLNVKGEDIASLNIWFENKAGNKADKYLGEGFDIARVD